MTIEQICKDTSHVHKKKTRVEKLFCGKRLQNSLAKVEVWLGWFVEILLRSPFVGPSGRHHDVLMLILWEARNEVDTALGAVTFEFRHINASSRQDCFTPSRNDVRTYSTMRLRVTWCSCLMSFRKWLVRLTYSFNCARIHNFSSAG